jgi:aspartyl-tRNA(Asn)/glutamyl-tRNA(Gln) amidotransferase subunit C
MFAGEEKRKIMIDRETVKNVAKLARLGLTEEEVDVFASQLSVILENIAKLQEVDVSGVSPTAHASRLSTIMRADISQPSYPPEVLLANAPEQEANCLKVPAVLEEA